MLQSVQPPWPFDPYLASHPFKRLCLYFQLELAALPAPTISQTDKFVLQSVLPLLSGSFQTCPHLFFGQCPLCIACSTKHRTTVTIQEFNLQEMRLTLPNSFLFTRLECSFKTRGTHSSRTHSGLVSGSQHACFIHLHLHLVVL